MGAGIVIPFSKDSGPERVKILQRVLGHLHDGAFEVRVYDVLPGEPWSPGGARNNGFDQTDFEVVVFNDADTIVPHHQIRSAIELAAQPGGGLVYAYDLYVRRDELGSVEREFFAPPSMGCAAISRPEFRLFGGFREWPGWGYEDCEFAMRVAPVRRISGIAEHLWHGERNRDDSPADADPALVAANLERFRESGRAEALSD